MGAVLFDNRIDGLKENCHAPFFSHERGERLTLIEDTRQQEGKHKNIEQYCKRHGIKVIRKCLLVGDYMFSDDDGNHIGNVSVDTKQDMMEICKDIMSSDHRRFRSECQRALASGIKLIILIEELPPFGIVDLWEVPRWKSSNQYHKLGDPMTLIEPVTLRKAMETMTRKYGVQFRFCTRRQSPQRIIKYLKGEYK